MYLPVCLSGLWSRESLLFCVQAVWQTNTIDLCSGLLRDNSEKKIASGQYRGHRVSTLEALFSIDLSSLQFRSNLCSWATNSSTVLASSVYSAIVTRPWHKQFFAGGDTEVEKDFTEHPCMYIQCAWMSGSKRDWWKPDLKHLFASQ